MAQYKTPNVYLKEESTLPASVAEVATSIPVFIGYTEVVSSKKDTTKSIINKPMRVTNMAEYEEVFGGVYQEMLTVSYEEDAGEFYIADTHDKTLSKFFLYQSIQHFFANGGGACWVVSIGGYTSEDDSTPPKIVDTTITKDAFMEGLNAIAKIDEVTLFVMPESVALSDVGHYDVHSAALAQASKLQDRFALIDVKQASIMDGDERSDAAAMRGKVVGDLKYGAAYYPYLRTSMARSSSDGKTVVAMDKVFPKLAATYHYEDAADTEIAPSDGVHTSTWPDHISDGTNIYDLSGYELDADGERVVVTPAQVQAPQLVFSSQIVGSEVDINGKDASGEVHVVAMETWSFTVTLAELNNAQNSISSTAKYNAVKSLLRSHYAILPASAAVAGCIAKTDASRGVWKAPANVALTQVLEPMVTIDNDQQEALNVDEVAGKSINAIRTFVGKGNLIWGARTLAGNDLEWRYVSVRRLFNMIEESLMKATAFSVFEPNTPKTWLKLKAMSENYLRSLWKQGALMGASEAQAFFVNVGLGESMTEQDILEGIMKIKIGLAASRPAEFIELTFQHKSLDG